MNIADLILVICIFPVLSSYGEINEDLYEVFSQEGNSNNLDNMNDVYARKTNKVVNNKGNDNKLDNSKNNNIVNEKKSVTNTKTNEVVKNEGNDNNLDDPKNANNVNENSSEFYSFESAKIIIDFIKESRARNKALRSSVNDYLDYDEYDYRRIKKKLRSKNSKMPTKKPSLNKDKKSKNKIKGRDGIARERTDGKANKELDIAEMHRIEEANKKQYYDHEEKYVKNKKRPIFGSELFNPMKKQFNSKTTVASPVEPKNSKEKDDTLGGTTIIPEAKGSEEITIIPEAKSTEDITIIPEAKSTEDITIIPEAKSSEKITSAPEASSLDDITMAPESASLENYAPESASVEEMTMAPEAAGLEETTIMPEAAGMEAVTIVPEAAGMEAVTIVPEAAGMEAVTIVPEAAGMEEVTIVPEAADLEEVTIVPEAAGLEETKIVPKSTTTLGTIVFDKDQKSPIFGSYLFNPVKKLFEYTTSTTVIPSRKYYGTNEQHKTDKQLRKQPSTIINRKPSAVIGRKPPGIIGRKPSAAIGRKLVKIDRKPYAFINRKPSNRRVTTKTTHVTNHTSKFVNRYG